MVSVKSFQYPPKAYNTMSAQVILPFLFQQVGIGSVLDVGCGIGSWLKVCLEQHVFDVHGIDGSEWNEDVCLVGSSQYFRKDISEPIEMGRKYDLLFCLEVAEHLPENKSDILIDTLVRHADLVLFSAAIPGQGGDGHENEQWPSYWESKFKKRGYYFSDVIRPKVWNHPDVELWYKQNAVLVVKHGSVFSEHFKPTHTIVDIVHPEMYDTHRRQAERMSLFETGKGSIKLMFRYLSERVFANFRS
jgi:2-polyprenyl-3-methyl-5-hydroxy-6-metoxy-1,4-benzoquinol methylase